MFSISKEFNKFWLFGDIQNQYSVLLIESDSDNDHDSELDETLTASECGSQGEIPMDISELENVNIEVC